MRLRMAAAIMAAAMLSTVSAQEITDYAGNGLPPTDTTADSSAYRMQPVMPQPDIPKARSDDNFLRDIQQKEPFNKHGFKPDFNMKPYLLTGLNTPWTRQISSDPYAFDFQSGGMLSSWKGGFISGSGSHATMPALMSHHNATFTAVQGIGNLTLSASVSADRYMLWHGSRTQLGISGAMTYSLNDNLSMTLFGNYYSNSSFYTMAAMPYFKSPGFGGHITYMGDRAGIDLGVERYYDPFARRWVTSPIITPKMKISEKFTLDLQMGWLVKEILEKTLFKSKSRQGPMIMPGPTSIPGIRPF